MSRRKLENKNIRNIQKTRSTYYITIPVDMVRSLAWRERQKVEVKRFGKTKIVISDWKPKSKKKK